MTDSAPKKDAMKASVFSESLKKAAADARRFSDGHNFMDSVTSCFFIKADDSSLTIESTNLSMTYTGEIEASVTSPGEVLIGADMFHQLVSRLPEGRVTLELKDASLNIRAGSARSNLRVRTGEFPRMKMTGGSYPLDTEEFKRGLAWCIDAASRETYRPSFNSITLDIKDGQMTMVSMDGFRMSIAQLGPTSVPDGKYIMPLVFANNLLRLITDEPLDVAVNAERIAFSTDSFTASALLISGSLPDYMAIIPSSANTTIHVQYAALKKALDLATALLKEKTSIRIQTEDDSLCLFAQDAEQGSILYTLDDAQMDSALAQPVGLNIKYLNAIPKLAENLVIKVAKQEQPIVLHPEAVDTHITLIMPIMG